MQACGAAPQGECSSTRTYASLVLARGAAPQGGMQLNVCLRKLGLNPCAPSRLVVRLRPLLQCGHAVPHPKGDTTQPVAGPAGPHPACLLVDVEEVAGGGVVVWHMQMQLHAQVLTKAATHAEAIADVAADEDVDAMLELLGRVRLSSGRRHVHLFCADTWSRTPVGKWLGGLTGLASSHCCMHLDPWVKSCVELDGYASR